MAAPLDICELWKTIKGEKNTYSYKYAFKHLLLCLASRLNGYIYSNGKSLNDVALFFLMAEHLFLG